MKIKITKYEYNILILTERSKFSAVTNHLRLFCFRKCEMNENCFIASAEMPLIIALLQLTRIISRYLLTRNDHAEISVWRFFYKMFIPADFSVTGLIDRRLYIVAYPIFWKLLISSVFAISGEISRFNMLPGLPPGSVMEIEICISRRAPSSGSRRINETPRRFAMRITSG